MSLCLEPHRRLMLCTIRSSFTPSSIHSLHFEIRHSLSLGLSAFPNRTRTQGSRQILQMTNATQENTRLLAYLGDARKYEHCHINTISSKNVLAKTSRVLGILVSKRNHFEFEQGIDKERLLCGLHMNVCIKVNEMPSQGAKTLS